MPVTALTAQPTQTPLRASTQVLKATTTTATLHTADAWDASTDFMIGTIRIITAIGVHHTGVPTTDGTTRGMPDGMAADGIVRGIMTASTAGAIRIMDGADGTLRPYITDMQVRQARATTLTAEETSTETAPRLAAIQPATDSTAEQTAHRQIAAHSDSVAALSTITTTITTVTNTRLRAVRHNRSDRADSEVAVEASAEAPDSVVEVAEAEALEVEAVAEVSADADKAKPTSTHCL